MKSSHGYTEKTLKQIKSIMQPDPTPVTITPRLPQPPTSDEQAEFLPRNTAHTDSDSDEETGDAN